MSSSDRAAATFSSIVTLLAPQLSDHRFLQLAPPAEPGFPDLGLQVPDLRRALAGELAARVPGEHLRRSFDPLALQRLTWVGWIPCRAAIDCTLSRFRSASSATRALHASMNRRLLPGHSTCLWRRDPVIPAVAEDAIGRPPPSDEHCGGGLGANPFRCLPENGSYSGQLSSHLAPRPAIRPGTGVTAISRPCFFSTPQCTRRTTLLPCPSLRAAPDRAPQAPRSAGAARS